MTRHDPPAGVGASAETRILELLKRRGASTIAEIAGTLGVSHEAARQRLNKLDENGLIESSETRGAVGRPKRQWRLTSRGHDRFPDAHAQLSVQLLDAALSLHGESGVELLLGQREQEMRSRYLRHCAEASSTAERLELLVELRDAEGYMARCEPLGDGEGWRLIEDHCPIGTAAGRCQAFCASELRLFQAVLGEGVEIQREEHLQRGGARCAYRIIPRG
ncbi:helix-turn-helix transcriptional regulator [Halotalea alkalilenta]|uniref:helix-turn-helix transcriptional regulator n=1 Tax=Halotalea alkalilenta TaxID=376489 RepID=UPI00069429D8|nr:winged helix-turn-helix transcriptional regulator [Halotalea alkalilenta]